MFSKRDQTIKDGIANLKTELENVDAQLKQKQKDRDTQAQQLLQAQEKQLQQLQKEVDQLKEQLEKMPKPCPRCGAPVRPTCGMSCASGGYYSD